MAGKKYGAVLLSLVKGALQTGSCRNEVLDTLAQHHVIYIYYNKTAFYVGQTNQFLTRHKQHLGETRLDYAKFSHVMVLFGQYVDGNSQNDLESLLITYLTIAHSGLPAAQKRKCCNRTQGNQYAAYSYRDEVLNLVLAPFWSRELQQAGLTHGLSLDHLRQSVLFKYSPFTTLTQQQCRLIQDIQGSAQNFLVEGAAGTGKTVVLTNLAAQLCGGSGRPKRKIGVAVKSNWVKTARSIFRAYAVQDRVTVGTPYQLIKSQEQFDVILVDEAHRLRWNCPKQNHLMSDIFDPNDPQKNELYLLGKQGRQLVLFYDPIQAIRPSDIPRRDFQRYIQGHSFQTRRLTSQFRVQINNPGASYTAEDYINGVCAFLQLGSGQFNPAVFQDSSPDAYFGVVGSIQELFDYADAKRQYHPTAQCRVVAGYARPWGSKYPPGNKKHQPYDWTEPGGGRWKWNSTHENWIARPMSEDEIGSVHAVQGVDLDYVGVVIAKDLTVRNGVITAAPSNYYDVNGTPPKETFSLDELSEYVRQIYYVLLTRGICGIRVYFEDPNLKRYFTQWVNSI